MWLIGAIGVVLVGLSLTLVGAPFWLVVIWGVLGAFAVVKWTND